MRNKIKIMAAVLSAVFVLSGISVYAQSSEPTTTVIEDNRTLTPKGNAELTDDVTDNENLQFITVTSKDGNVFYFVIDKGADSENVYFLNTVDDTDLEALAEQKDGAGQKPVVKPSEETEPTQEPTEQEQPKEDKKEQKQEPQKQNNTLLYVLLFVLAGGGIGAYYYKVILPKKKLEQADDIEDFEFEDDEEIIETDETTDDTETEDDTE